MNPSPRWMAYSTSPELTPVFWLAARTRKGMFADKFCSQTLTQSLTPKTHVNSDWVRVCDLPLYPNEKTNKQNKTILARSISGRAAKSRRRFFIVTDCEFFLPEWKAVYTEMALNQFSTPGLKSWLEQKTFKFQRKPISHVLFFFSEVFISLSWYGLTSMFLIHPKMSTVWKWW